MSVIRVLGSDVGVGDWIALNCHGVMRMGKVRELYANRQGFKTGHFVDPSGDRFVWDFNLHEKYQLFTFCAKDDDGRYDDELIHAITSIGRAMSQRYARMLVEKIKPRSDFRFMSRDGRLVFKDGSSFRVNDDGTRTIYNSKGEFLEWPKLKRV